MFGFIGRYCGVFWLCDCYLVLFRVVVGKVVVWMSSFGGGRVWDLGLGLFCLEIRF